MKEEEGFPEDERRLNRRKTLSLSERVGCLSKGSEAMWRLPASGGTGEYQFKSELLQEVHLLS